MEFFETLTIEKLLIYFYLYSIKKSFTIIRLLTSQKNHESN